MGLILLIAVGAILGWLASIFFRLDDRHDIMLNVGIGIAGSLMSALFIRPGAFLDGISASALLTGVAGSLLILTLFNVIRQNAVR